MALFGFGNPFRAIGRALSAIGIDGAGEFLGREASDAIRKRVKEAVFEGPPRDQLLSEFRRIPRDKMENMWRRHREALAAHRENRFCTLLLKVPKEDRADMYPWLDRLTEEEFEQSLAMLANDVVPQFAKYVLRTFMSRGERISAAAGAMFTRLGRVGAIAKDKAGEAGSTVAAGGTELGRGIADGWRRRRRID